MPNFDFFSRPQVPPLLASVQPGRLPLLEDHRPVAERLLQPGKNRVEVLPRVEVVLKAEREVVFKKSY